MFGAMPFRGKFRIQDYSHVCTHFLKFSFLIRVATVYIVKSCVRYLAIVGKEFSILHRFCRLWQLVAIPRATLIRSPLAPLTATATSFPGYLSRLGNFGHELINGIWTISKMNFRSTRIIPGWMSVTIEPKVTLKDLGPSPYYIIFHPPPNKYILYEQEAHTLSGILKKTSDAGVNIGISLRKWEMNFTTNCRNCCCSLQCCNDLPENCLFFVLLKVWVDK